MLYIGEPTIRGKKFKNTFHRTGYVIAAELLFGAHKISMCTYLARSSGRENNCLILFVIFPGSSSTALNILFTLSNCRLFVFSISKINLRL